MLQFAKIKNRMKNTDYKTELNQIKTFIDSYAGYDISTRSRKAETVRFRTLYFKIAMESTFWSLQKIAKIVDRDHATAIHSRTMFKEIMNYENIKNLYYVYKYEILNQKITVKYTDIDQYNELKEKYNELLINQKSTYEELNAKTGQGLTINEKLYRQLDEDKKQDYDKRASLVLKSYKWKEHNSTFEIIDCGGINDARATTR
jgi:hypothetical protein